MLSKKYFDFIKTDLGRTVIGLGIIVLSLVAVILFNNFRTKSSNQSEFQINDRVDINNKINNRYDIKIEGITTNIKNKEGYIPLITSKYDLTGKDNSAFYSDLIYGAVVDTFDETGLKVISAHELDYFTNIGSDENIGKKIYINSSKYPNEKWIYEIYKAGIIHKNKADIIYNNKSDSNKDIVVYSCQGSQDNENPKNRGYVYAKLVSEPENIKSDWNKIDYGIK